MKLPVLDLVSAPHDLVAHDPVTGWSDRCDLCVDRRKEAGSKAVLRRKWLDRMWDEHQWGKHEVVTEDCELCSREVGTWLYSWTKMWFPRKALWK